MEAILSLVGRGELKVKISETHGLERLPDIHRRMAERDTTARIVLRPDIHAVKGGD
jgi:D-arabinose 1-dehydrogenase-like Zn-dependent alcohol dehydrogenase